MEPQKDPKNYKWGFFYYNPKDDRLFVEKPNPGMGVTINFAHKYGLVWFIGMLAFFGFIIGMIAWKGR